MTKYQPINHQVLLKLIPLPDKTASGLCLPDTYQEGAPGQVQEAEVVAAAADARYGLHIEDSYKYFTVGQIVLAYPRLGQSVNLDGVEYRLQKDEDILAVVA